MASEFYTLDSNFLRREVINETKSIVWTERFNDPGDFILEMPATAENITKFAPDVYIAKSDSERVGIVRTQKIKDNVLTVSGKDLLELLSHKGLQSFVTGRYMGVPNSPTPPETRIKYIIETFVMEDPLGYNVSPLWGDVDARQLGTRPYGMGGWREAIPNLTLGTTLTPGANENISTEHGYVLPALQELAKPRRIGLTFRLASASVGSYSLKFDYYKGRDLTSSQTTYQPVVFIPEDSLDNVEEIRTKEDYKNVALAYAPSVIIAGAGNTSKGTGIFSYDSPHPSGMQRRVLMVYVDDVTAADLSNDPNKLQSFLDERAKQELAKHLYITTVDGEVRPNGPYKYKTDYLLGDKVELRSSFGLTTSAYVTEVIYSQDENGEKEYPTLEFV